MRHARPLPHSLVIPLLSAGTLLAAAVLGLLLWLR
jgi:hypothetical protein